MGRGRDRARKRERERGISSCTKIGDPQDSPALDAYRIGVRCRQRAIDHVHKKEEIDDEQRAEGTKTKTSVGRESATNAAKNVSCC